MLVTPALGGCGGSGGETKYALTISTSPAGGGSVNPASGKYNKDTKVALTATPEQGYIFDHWSGAATGTSNMTTVTMDTDKAVTAHFSGKYTLNIHVTPSGAGTIDPFGGAYDKGTEVTLTANPAKGSVFDHWSGDAAGTSNEITITMDTEKRIVAHFIKSNILKTVIIPSGAGTISPADGIYDKGTEVKLIATPSERYVFDRWSGDIEGTSKSITVTMDTDKTAIANFSEFPLADTPWPMFRQGLHHTGKSQYSGANDSALKWLYETGDQISSSPAIGTDGTIYFGSQNNYFYALNADGSLKWNYETGGNVDSSPAINSDGTIYFGSRDNHLYALNPSGSLKWSYETEGWVTSSPAIGADGTIYFGSRDNHLYALNKDSSLKWRYETGDYIRSSPAIDSDGNIYFGSDDGNLYALNPDGSLKWLAETGNRIVSSPAIGSGGIIYFGSRDNHLYALNAGGSTEWLASTGDWVDTSPAIGSDGTIYFGADDGYLYALNQDGSWKWRYETGNQIWSSPSIGANGTIYFGSDDGNLYALNPDGSLKWRYETGAGCESSPVIDSDGTIYFGATSGVLYAIGDKG